MVIRDAYVELLQLCMNIEISIFSANSTNPENVYNVYEPYLQTDYPHSKNRS